MTTSRTRQETVRPSPQTRPFVAARDSVDESRLIDPERQTWNSKTEFKNIQAFNFSRRSGLHCDLNDMFYRVRVWSIPSPLRRNGEATRHALYGRFKRHHRPDWHSRHRIDDNGWSVGNSLGQAVLSPGHHLLWRTCLRDRLHPS